MLLEGLAHRLLLLLTELILLLVSSAKLVKVLKMSLILGSF